MHSRLFQISDQPVYEDDFTSEYDYYDGFVGGIADSIRKEAGYDRRQGIKELRNLLQGAAEVDVKNGRIKIIDKMKYFEPMFRQFKKHLASVNGMSLEDFAGANIYHANKMFDAFVRRYEFYVDWGGMYETLDELMREVQNGDKLYVGAVFDYHW